MLSLWAPITSLSTCLLNVLRSHQVSALSGYDSVEDFMEQETLSYKCSDQNCWNEEFDLALVARFHCIRVGDSSLIELYNERWKNSRLSLLMPESSVSHLSASAIRNWGDATKEISADEISDTSQFFAPQLPNSSSYKQCLSTLPNDSLASNVDSGAELDKLNANECLINKESKLAKADVCVNSVLDTAVKFIPLTTSRQCHQLEEGGFYTVECLLLIFLISNV